MANYQESDPRKDQKNIDLAKKYNTTVEEIVDVIRGLQSENQNAYNAIDTVYRKGEQKAFARLNPYNGTQDNPRLTPLPAGSVGPDDNNLGNAKPKIDPETGLYPYNPADPYNDRTKPAFSTPGDDTNPYQKIPAPDPNLPPIQQDYETNPHLYDFLREKVSPTAGVEESNLAFQSLIDSIKGRSSSESDKLFQDLISEIDKQSGVRGEAMKMMLDQIDADTSKSVGGLKSDFLERGLGGPAQLSDIEASGLGDLYSGATKAKAQARLGLAQTNADTLASAYGNRYATMNDFLKSRDTDLATAYGNRSKSVDDLIKSNLSQQTQRDTALATILANQEQERLARRKGKYSQPNSNTSEPGLFDKILSNINLGFNIGK